MILISQRTDIREGSKKFIKLKGNRFQSPYWVFSNRNKSGHSLGYITVKFQVTENKEKIQKVLGMGKEVNNVQRIWNNNAS